MLGPLSVTVDGVEVPLGGPRERAALAVLLLDRNRVVSAGRLVDALWGEAPPPTSRQQVQMCVSNLRHRLNGAGADDIIETRRPGYLIRVDETRVDVDRFDALVAIARSTADPAAAERSLRDAIALRRGMSLADVECLAVRAGATGLDEAVATAAEDWLETLLLLDRHDEVCQEATLLINRYPMRERLVRQQMIALARAGRAADALNAYRRARDLLVDELGVEPSASLRNLQRAILAGEPVAAPPARTPVPRQLPRPGRELTDRGSLIKQLHNHVTGTGGKVTAPVAVLCGPAGVGKTALAVFVANQVADRFPDGQLYVTCGDVSRHRGAYLLERLLRGLGTAGAAIPDEAADRLALYRSLTAGRRLLIVLDDATEEGEVHDLLPATAGCAAIVTSRPRLAGLTDALHVDVRALPPAEGVKLLIGLTGRHIDAAEAEAARSMVRLCGGLPLALNIAAARLVAKPHWTVAGLAARMESHRRRLDELSYGDLGVRPSISLSHDGLDGPARTLFRRLGLLEVDDFAAWVAAPLLDVPVDEAVDVLELLVEARLVEADGSGRCGTRYRMHELVRVFSWERLEADEPATDRRAALARMLGCVLRLTRQADERYYGGDYGKTHSGAHLVPLPPVWCDELLAQPLQWLERERALLLTAVGQADRAGLTELCWDLAITAPTLYEKGSYLDDWRITAEIALRCCRRAGDRRGEAAIEHSLGLLAHVRGRPEAVLRHMETSRQLYASMGERYGLALTGRGISSALKALGRPSEAKAGLYEALRLVKTVDDPIIEVDIYYRLIGFALDEGRTGEAESLVEAGLTAAARATFAGDGRTVHILQHRRGQIQLEKGEVDSAVDTLRDLLSRVRANDDQVGEAHVRLSLGDAMLRRPDLAGATEQYITAMALAVALHIPLLIGRLLLAQGRLHTAAHRYEEAEALLVRGIGVFRDLGAVHWETQAQDALATCRRTVAGQSSDSG
jgi:DNA-binding SARP family transcriptional activator/tetratricopeptide (TPR) repeat protein